MRRFKGTKGMILLAIMICLIASYYFYISNIPSKKEEEVTVSAIQGVLLRNLEKNYPPSPKEVIKYYCDITQCFYNEKLSEKDIQSLGEKAKELYDTELKTNKTDEQYLLDLKNDIKSFSEKDIKISSYSTSASTDVEYFQADGFEFAKLYAAYSIRQGTSLTSTNMVFLLRKDETGHWKIYGWDLAE